MFLNGLPFTLIAGSNSKSTVIAGQDSLRRKTGRTSEDGASTTLYLPRSGADFIGWRNGIVEDYSKCHFTFSRDKLAPERGASLQLECFLFALNLLWLDYDAGNGIVLNQIDMVFMQEYAGLDTKFGTVIDLDEDDPSFPRGKTLQMLAQEGKLFLVHLYATLYLRAMIVARLGNKSPTYCRLGAFEVALGLQSFPLGEEWQISKERGWNAN
ncbi:uncharacterized protein BDW43DRAFT_308233 [Aspergillus alliaceus]|uniref:uncharacterized protein n=1 Tax=Petromyces alliaceus TaxID=209559 RepID=UPI0012A5CBEF|nr:uncharacterized protein BDW43DRAFT_308233 [Aspergillus alliaceus]KAB8236556.1 hypothetical protein BDW43DRAFT_308233 [Aspergillus alliaceus]